MTTVTAGPLNDLPARTPSARPTPTRKQEEHLGDDEALPAPGREGPAVGVGIPVPEKEHGHGQQKPASTRENPSEIIPARPHRSHGRPPGMSSESAENFLLPAILHPRTAITPAIWRMLCVAA